MWRRDEIGRREIANEVDVMPAQFGADCPLITVVVVIIIATICLVMMIGRVRCVSVLVVKRMRRGWPHAAMRQHQAE